MTDLATHPKYRPDIDGLRAVAILLVVVYHAFPQVLHGGYVGVDIFFVISGYLISTIIFKSLDQQQFSFRDFYARRIRRIFPALLVVMLASLAAAWLFLFPDEFRTFGKDLYKSGLFIVNFRMMHRGGYFEAATALNPFAHIWSLCVEEQYYLLWPLFTVLFYRRQRHTIVWLLILLVLSFGANLIIAKINLQADFYLPVTRFWELWLGSLLAWLVLYRNGLRRFLSQHIQIKLSDNAVAVTGCLFLLVAILALRESSLFPGAWALLPTLGTFCLIEAGPNAWCNRQILSSRITVFIGLLSYPLYLWHWPILAFTRVLTGEKISPWLGMIDVLAAFILAMLTYFLLETRIRFHRGRAVTATLLGLMAVMIALGIIVGSKMIKPRLETAQTEKILAAINDWQFTGDFNFKKDKFKTFEIKGDTPETILFIGDSHMEHYWPRIQADWQAHPHPRPTLAIATSGGCRPFPKLNNIELGYHCDKFYDFALKTAHEPRVKTVVFAAYWEIALGAIYRGGRATEYDAADRNRTPIDQVRADQVFADLSHDMAALQQSGKKVYLILSNPTSVDFNPKSMVSRLDGHIITRTVDRQNYVDSVAPVMDRLRQAAQRAGAIVIDPVPALCDAQTCPNLSKDNVPLYRDNHHLSFAFSRDRASFIDAIFQ